MVGHFQFQYAGPAVGHWISMTRLAPNCFRPSTKMSIPEGDYERGKKIFKTRCLQCHVIDSDINKNGPTLKGLIGRMSGSVEGFLYSTGNKNKVCALNLYVFLYICK